MDARVVLSSRDLLTQINQNISNLLATVSTQAEQLALPTDPTTEAVAYTWVDRIKDFLA